MSRRTRELDEMLAKHAREHEEREAEMAIDEFTSEFTGLAGCQRCGAVVVYPDGLQLHRRFCPATRPQAPVCKA